MFNLGREYPMDKLNTPSKPQTEFYRVGLTTCGMTTLTLLTPNGATTTIWLGKEECRQMIRMLKSTMEEENE